MIRYNDTIEGVSPDALRGFFVGWPNPPSPATHLAIVRGSYRVVLAMDDERVVGYVATLSDGVLYAHLSLLEVLPEYRRRGTGTELVRRVLNALSHLYAIDVLCDPELQMFYERLGLSRAVGMMLRRYEHQAGVN